MIGGDDRAAHGLRLRHHASERFRIGRRRHDHIGQHEGRRHVATMIDRAHLAFQPARAHQLLQLLPVIRAPLVGADQQAADIAAAQPRHGFDQQSLAFPAREAARQHDDRHAVRQAPLARQRDHALLTHLGGIEAERVDAARNHADARRIGAVFLDKVSADEIGDGDHAHAARHHRIVPALDLVAVIIGSVERRDEGPARALRGVIGAPCRRAAARMHQRHVVLFDHLGQPADITADDEGILGAERQRDMRAPGALDLAHHRPAFGGDDGPPAAFGQRHGDVDRAALDAAGHQAGQHLQDRPGLVPRRRGLGRWRYRGRIGMGTGVHLYVQFQYVAGP